jgi:hypothetical protein
MTVPLIVAKSVELLAAEPPMATEMAFCAGPTTGAAWNHSAIGAALPVICMYWLYPLQSEEPSPRSAHAWTRPTASALVPRGDGDVDVVQVPGAHGVALEAASARASSDDDEEENAMGEATRVSQPSVLSPARLRGPAAHPGVPGLA